MKFDKFVKNTGTMGAIVDMEGEISLLWLDDRTDPGRYYRSGVRCSYGITGTVAEDSGRERGRGGNACGRFSSTG